MGTPVQTWLYQWVEWNHGLLPFAPIALVAAWGWRGIGPANRRLAWIFLGVFLIYYTFISSISIWSGGFCYGPRYLVPIIPLLMLGLVGAFEERERKTPWSIAALSGIGVVSMIINALGSVPYWSYWATHPLKGLL